MTVASRLRILVPASWRRWLRRLRRGPLYSGDYARWEDAVRDSRGYADPLIVDRVVAAARAVRDGRAAWERDTVLFPTPAANPPLLRALQAAAQRAGGRLQVLDFGGALGSTWWQHRPFLSDVPDVRWSVIEQPDLVAAGRREFQLGPVRFYDSLSQCLEAETPRVMLLSSVLPYLEHPYALLDEVNSSALRELIVDRTGFVGRGRDRLTVQRVPPEIYPASYPCWFLDRARFLAALGSAWRIDDEWVTDDEVDIDAAHRGLALRRSVP